MNFIKRVSGIKLSLSVLFFVFALVLGFPSSSTYADDKPVQLYYADSYGVNSTFNYVQGYIGIKNIGYEKNVTIHYSLDNSSTWNDIAAQYYKPNTDGYEVWRFTTPTSDLKNFKFAIKYQVNGQTYWDNNDGNNYSVDAFAQCFGKSFVNLKSSYKYNSSPSTQTINTDIISKNLGAPQTVKVRYTTDNWTTYTDVEASPEYTTGDGEHWYLSFGLPINANFQFAICYSVNGVEYWDNNFGSNYSNGNYSSDGNYDLTK